MTDIHLKSNNVVFIDAINCWFHERCVPAHTPPVTRTLDMNDISNIWKMPFEICAFCSKKLILGNGRIVQPMKSYPSFILSDDQEMDVKKTSKECIGTRLVDLEGHAYTIIHMFLQTSADKPGEADLMALCEPIQNDERAQKLYNIEQSFGLIKTVLMQIADPQVAISQALDIIKHVEASHE